MNYNYEEADRIAREFETEHANDIVVTEDNIEFYPGYEPDYSVDYDYGYPDLNLGLKRSTITGSLRAKVLERNGLDPEALHHVEILENHENGGYCGSCAFEYTVFKILIDGDEVLHVAYEESPFAVFQAYLDGDDA